MIHVFREIRDTSKTRVSRKESNEFRKSRVTRFLFHERRVARFPFRERRVTISFCETRFARVER